MRKPAAAVGAILLVVTAACSGDPGQPVDPQVRPSFSVSSETPLSVVITAKTNLVDPDVTPVNQTLPVKATATGGTGPYIFKWLSRICNKGPSSVYCEPDYKYETYPISTSGNTSTVSHTFLKTDVRTWFVVEVQDNSGRSGADAVFIRGPYQVSTLSVMKCDIKYYPLVDYMGDPNNQPKDYRRDPCTGVKEYAPQ